MLTVTTLALPPRTNIPRPTKKNPKDTPDRAFNKLAWHNFFGTEYIVKIDDLEMLLYNFPFILLEED